MMEIVKFGITLFLYCSVRVKRFLSSRWYGRYAMRWLEHGPIVDRQDYIDFDQRLDLSQKLSPADWSWSWMRYRAEDIINNRLRQRLKDKMISRLLSWDIEIAHDVAKKSNSLEELKMTIAELVEEKDRLHNDREHRERRYAGAKILFRNIQP